MRRERRTDCLLGGCGSPAFPGGIDLLCDLYERLQLSNAALSALARGICEFWYSQSLPSTLDGTQWYVSLVFRFGADAVLTVLFPFSSERCSVALYAHGDVPESAADCVLQQLISGCKAIEAA